MVTLDYKHILSERLECLPLLIVKFLAPFNVNAVFSQVFNRARCVVASFFVSHFLFTSCYFWLFWGRAEGVGKKNRKEKENISYWIRTILNWFLGPGPGPCIKLTLLRVFWMFLVESLTCTFLAQGAVFSFRLHTPSSHALRIMGYFLLLSTEVFLPAPTPRWFWQNLSQLHNFFLLCMAHTCSWGPSHSICPIDDGSACRFQRNIFFSSSLSMSNISHSFWIFWTACQIPVPYILLTVEDE